MGLVACFWAGTAWLQRSSIGTVELPPAGPYRIISSAGPVEVNVTDADRPHLQYDASWLLLGPEVASPPPVELAASNDSPGGSSGSSSDSSPGNPSARTSAGSSDQEPERSGTVEITCPARLPCRAATTVDLPRESAPGASELTIGTVDGDITVIGYTGDLVVVTAETSSVSLGAVGGRVSISGVDGDVAGFGLTAAEIDVEVDGGAVELRFASRPRSLKVRSNGGPVTIGLPDGPYAVSVSGVSGSDSETTPDTDTDTAAVINVGQTADADSTIDVHARGPVRIEPNE